MFRQNLHPTCWTPTWGTTISKSVKTNEITCIGLTYALFPTSGTLKIGDEETKVSYTERTVQSNGAPMRTLLHLL